VTPRVAPPGALEPAGAAVGACGLLAAGPEGNVSKQVLMTADNSGAGGGLSAALDLARAFAARDVRVALCVLGAPSGPAQRAAAAGVAGLTVHESGIRSAWVDEQGDDAARAAAWLLEIEDRVRPDVVHLHACAAGALPFRAPRVVAAETCLLSWFEAVEGRPAPPRFDRYRAEAAAGIAAAAALVAPTRALLEALVRQHGPHPRARVIPPGRDPARHRPAAKDDVVLAVGPLWDPAGNLAALSAVARALPWPVRVAGSDLGPDGVRRPLVDVEHLGVLSEDALAAVVARAAVLAAPARFEPAGGYVLEAALSGCALVLGDIPSLREMWGGAALFVDPGDPEDLARALTGTLGNRGVRAALGDRARLRGRDFSVERAALSYLALYEEVLARPARSTPPRRLSTPPPRA
jgi:glycosyltransferase involved in cell wall biosynthesis